jgi:imidazolonepropionase-like amidohydrolase
MLRSQGLPQAEPRRKADAIAQDFKKPSKGPLVIQSQIRPADPTSDRRVAGGLINALTSITFRWLSDCLSRCMLRDLCFRGVITAGLAAGMTASALLLISCGAPTSAQETISSPPLGTFAFVDVNVVPMESERVVPHQTVIIEKRSIVAVGPVATVPVRTNATRIEGHGSLYLMPGLADMHSHADQEDDLTLYVANGVTTILTLGGTSRQFVRETRNRIHSGEIIGPTAYAAQVLDGPPAPRAVRGEDQARKVVDEAKAEGYDLIKVYNDLGKKEFYATVAEARRQQMAVVGHAVRSVELKDALNAGQVLVVHGEEYIYMYFHKSRDPALASSAASFTHQAGAYVIPNLSAYEAIALQWGKPKQVQVFLERPEARYLRPCLRQHWAEGADYKTRAGSLDGNLEFLRLFTRALSDQHVPLMLGTDSPPIPGMYPGYSIHDDLRNMGEAGLTLYQALSAGTRVPGEFIGRFVRNSEPFGTVSVGSRADLLLLAHNPLDSLDNVREPLGVMAAGHWMTANFLHAILENYGKEYRKAGCTSD